jgi:two-component system chemotaxis sensor kinase CheA
LSNNDINVEELLKRIQEEEEYVKSQTICYDEYLPEFFARAEEDLAIIESCAIELEHDHSNMDAINSMFRSFHNIKGSSGFVAQENIQNIAHQTETMLDSCRKSLLQANKTIVDLILKSADLIRQICDNVDINIDEGFLEQIYLHTQNLIEADNQRTDYNCDANTELNQENKDNTEYITEIYQNEFWEEFVSETKVYIEESKKYLEQLKVDVEDSKLVSALFKNLHSIKGLAGFSEQKIPEILAFKAEKFLDKSRNNLSSVDIDVLTGLISLLEQFCEDSNIGQDKEFLEKVCSTIETVKSNIKLKEFKLIEEELPDNDFFNDFVVETSEHIQKIENDLLTLEKTDFNNEIINSLLRSFHAIKGLSGFADQYIIGNIAHECESLLQFCKENNNNDKNITNLLFYSIDFIKKICTNNKINQNADFLADISVHLQQIHAVANGENNELLKQLTIINPAVVNIKEDPEEANNEVEVIKQEESPKSDDMIPAQQTEVHQTYTAPVNQHLTDTADTSKNQQHKPVSENYMRIATTKVDSLVDMVGELVINQSLIEQYAISYMNADNTFITNFNRMVRITKDLQNLAMFLRLVPIKATFQKITRVARDTINELGKNIDFSVSGEETEIDRIVIEKLLDPLVHLVKNAISHGIEPAEVRLSSNKSANGSVKINAYNKRGSIYIEMVDDGGGINTEIVYKKALEKGLIDPNKEYTEKEIQEFIMLPGFSTLDVANNISGRGVGMDVVKTEIQNIGGKVEIESTRGVGTKFTLKIPLNHAIMNGLVVEMEDSKYIIPTVNVKQIVQPKEEQWIFTQDVRTKIRVRDDIIPLVYIKQLFGEDLKEEPRLIVVIELDQKYIALPVKNVLNRQEIVIKPVAEEFAHLDFVSGMSILGDGKVSLILDIESMFMKGA